MSWKSEENIRNKLLGGKQAMRTREVKKPGAALENKGISCRDRLRGMIRTWYKFDKRTHSSPLFLALGHLLNKHHQRGSPHAGLYPVSVENRSIIYVLHLKIQIIKSDQNLFIISSHHCNHSKPLNYHLRLNSSGSQIPTPSNLCSGLCFSLQVIDTILILPII